MKRWIALFSQSGSEIVSISEKLGRWPDVILTNNMDKNTSHRDLMMRSNVRRMTHPRVIKEIEKDAACFERAFITLHGYLRIMPEIPNEMYNGHPGDIIKYPELKGKDPQKKALELGLPTTGCVIHKVTKEVDSGEILDYNTLKILEDETEESLIVALRKMSIDMWVKFLSEKFKDG
tara:strand:- start:3545 stop:4075 length:531 start_codon:yes stop_codon:yes gene_type:complete